MSTSRPIGGEAQLPFGGTKATGVGEREMAEEGLNFFTELKTVFINYSGKAERLMIRYGKKLKISIEVND